MKLRKTAFSGSLSPEVTALEEKNRQLARRAAAEGFVLLKNEDGVLPLKTGSKIGLYGTGAAKTFKGGTGSGDVNERFSVTIREGLENAGFLLTSRDWLSSCEALYTEARLSWKQRILDALPSVNGNFFEAYSSHQFSAPAGPPVDAASAASDGADTAIFVLGRVAGENRDRRDTAGDYYISEEEKAQLNTLSLCYRNLILILNSGGPVDLGFTEELPRIKAILYFVQAGEEGGNALADVLSGAVTPSGKLTDSWPLRYADLPNAGSFSFKSGNVFREYYSEGIYVGYRYFDTFDVPVRYSFGFGLSYTSFSIRADALLHSSPSELSVRVTVKNTGTSFRGKETVQIYAACPQGSLSKEFRRLAAFGKTKELRPGEEETMILSFPLYALASYDEAMSSWILEKGSYGIFAGDSLENAVPVGSVLLDKTAVPAACRRICPLCEALQELIPDPVRLAAKTAAWQKEAADLPVLSLSSETIRTEFTDYGNKPQRSTESRQLAGKLSTEQLIRFASGEIRNEQSEFGSAGQSVPGAAAETTCAGTELGIAAVSLADGPAGLRLKKSYQAENGRIRPMGPLDALDGGFFASAPAEGEGIETYYQFCTAFPVGTLLAQTWNTDLVREVGEAAGREIDHFHVTLWLAPGMNIHRNPLCGRNFEYFSEDPLLSGMMASAMTEGVQSIPGIGTTIKHFAGNNQEDNRMGSDDIISERALREIYLKGFEIAVKKAHPMAVMTSYNMINGIHAANSYDLCTNVLKREWGFNGVVMTDWCTTTQSTAGICTASGCIRAGNDLIMPGAESDHRNLREALADGTLALDQLRECVTATIDMILKSNRCGEDF